jgi:hypothetical protein
MSFFAGIDRDKYDTIFAFPRRVIKMIILSFGSAKAQRLVSMKPDRKQASIDAPLFATNYVANKFGRQTRFLLDGVEFKCLILMKLDGWPSGLWLQS